jgi:hypothetical protein
MLQTSPKPLKSLVSTLNPKERKDTLMSLTKQLYFDQLETDSPENRIANINRQLAIALRAASDCEHPDFETLETVARAVCKARDEMNHLATTIGTLESLTY